MRHIHPTAVIAPWVELGEDCVVEAYAVLGTPPVPSAALARKPATTQSLSIGRNTVICAHAVVYAGSEIGSSCFVGNHASIRENSIIGDFCVIGRLVTINYDCRIADRVRFQDTTHITGGCIIGSECFFGVGVITSNDRRVDLDDYHFPGSNPPIFGRKIMIGSGANILAGVKVGDNAVIAAGALVVKDVPARGKAIGARAMITEAA